VTGPEECTAAPARQIDDRKAGIPADRRGDAGVHLRLRQRRLGRRLGSSRGLIGRRIDHDQPQRAVLAGVPRLEAGVAVPPLDLFFLIERRTGRRETADESELPLHVDILIVVDPQLRGGDAITGRHHRGFSEMAGAGESGGLEVGAGEHLAVHRHHRRIPHLDRHRHLEGVQEGAVVAAGGEADLLETLHQPVARSIETGGAHPAPFARIVGQPGHVVVEADRRLHRRRMLHPAGDEDVGLPGCAAAAVGGEGEALAVGREERETVEAGHPGDALQMAAVEVHRPDVELPALGIAVVRGEEQALAVGEEGRRERSRPEVRHLVDVGAVGLGDVDLELGGPDQAVGEQIAVFVHLLARRRPRRAPDDVRAVGREERAAVVARRRGEAADVRPVGVHAVEIEIAVARRGKDHRAVHRADGRLGVIGVVIGQPLQVAAVGLGGVDLVVGIDRPDVAVRTVRRRRAGIAGGMGGRKQDALTVFGKIRARRLPLAGRHQRHRVLAGFLAVGGHAEDLVAGIGRMRRLHRQLAAVGRPVGLGVLALEGELDEIGEMDLARIERRRSGLTWDRGRCLGQAGPGEHNGEEQERQG